MSPRARSDSAAADEPRAYHHGDLRPALIRAALTLLRTEGPEALTLRGVARAAGVSQTAPYRHFADRRELVAAVAEDGFRRMREAMLEAARSAEGPAGFRQVAFAYVRFAHAHPAEYRVMFGPEVARHADFPDLRAESHGILGFVAEGIGALQTAGLVGPGDPAIMAVALWSMLHGLVMLSLDGQTAGVAPSLEALVEETTRLMMFGMARRPAP
ncbi:TetR/AcrR family transcriptional regulator [Roseisolibacter agri]|uniref:TetR family transcriptional regulator n=1 Tax=Roseisolibacter agri TaxID=2014610 RepID=A0AA37QJ82_9BACT|nr:TetR/AcrR family transcriptional regulator [Roseisolibacter agri]GLC26813.1 TetR family transcriptional regulator [Roseisolibacter agri]